MYIIRAIAEKDTEAFIEMAYQAGIGMTSMPKNREILLRKVVNAIESFNKRVEQPGKENYLFVLEDLKTGTIVGASGIEAKTGCVQPLTFYRKEYLEMPSLWSSSLQKIPLLRMVHYYEGPTEICSLYLSPQHRHEGLGRLLSLSRFLFIASHLERFDRIVFAEMRGFIDENQASPFWKGIGLHFFDISFESLMHTQEEETVDLSKGLPPYPIYISLLPQEVQKSISQVHPETRPALNMLIQEGFILTEELDLFDGGPKIEAETKEIRTIKTSMRASIAKIVNGEDDAGSSEFMISNEHLDFRACYGHIETVAPEQIALSRKTAQALNLEEGEFIRYVRGSV
jgi:arginine N-succinyltransferase